MSNGRPVARPPAAGRWRARIVLLMAAGLVAAAGWWCGRSAPRGEPPLPGGIEDRELRAAAEEARNQVLADPDSADAWGRLGMVYLANAFEPEAGRCFAEAGRLNPADARWPYYRGRIAILRDPDAALPLFREAAAAVEPRSPHRSEVLVHLAEALLERRQLDEAETILRGEEDKPEYRHRAAFDLGLIALARDDRPAAAKYLKLAGQSPVVRQKATALLAALVRAQDDPAAAGRHEDISAESPLGLHWPEPLLDEVRHFRVGRVEVWAKAQGLEDEGRFAEAGELLEQLARTQPAARPLTRAGLNFTRAGTIDRALPLLREAVRLDPADPQARYNLALSLFTRAEKENLRTPGAAGVRAAFEEVVEHARWAAELKPDYGTAYLFWGLSLKHLGRPEAAVEPLRNGVAARPEEFELQLALGEALIATGRGAEAKTYLENATRLDPKDPRPGRALAHLGGPGK